jgi:hypothetical protein
MRLFWLLRVHNLKILHTYIIFCYFVFTFRFFLESPLNKQIESTFFFSNSLIIRNLIKLFESDQKYFCQQTFQPLAQQPKLSRFFSLLMHSHLFFIVLLNWTFFHQNLLPNQNLNIELSCSVNSVSIYKSSTSKLL